MSSATSAQGGVVIRLWDVPTRLFHWLLVGLVVAAFVTIKIGGNAVEWHGRIGHAIVALLAFRIVWGFVGSTQSRFTHFVRGPGAVIAYLKGRWQGVGHNPLGALSVLCLIALIGFQSVSGLFITDDVAFQGPLFRAVSEAASTRLADLHRGTEVWIYALVGLHVLAVVFYSVVKKDNLVRPMITGNKAVPAALAGQGTRGGGVLAFAVALVIAVAVGWVTSGALIAPPQASAAPAPAADPGW